MRSSTPFVRDVAGQILRLLQVGPCTAEEMQIRTGASRSTVVRALEWLRGCDVGVVFSRPANVWEVGAVESIANWSLRDLVAAKVMGDGEARALATLASLSLGHRRVACPTLDLPPMARTRGRRWTTAEIAKAHRLSVAGLTHDEVGRVLGRTRSAVSLILNRRIPRSLRVVHASNGQARSAGGGEKR